MENKFIGILIFLAPIVASAQFESQINIGRDFATQSTPSSTASSLSPTFNAGATNIATSDPILMNVKAPSANGQGTLAEQGTANINSCRADPSGPGCNAVNMLANYGGGSVALPANDPMLVAAKAALDAGGLGGPFSPGTQCTTVTVVDKAPTYGNLTCTQSAYILCNKTLDVTCAFQSKDISNISTIGNANYSRASIGLYDYSMPLSGAGIGWPMRANITFNIDSPNAGSYISAIANNLDDTALVAVNGIVVYFGHPNSGGQWGYPTFGTTPGYIYGYAENLMSCGMAVVGYDAYDNPIMENQCNVVATSMFQLAETCPFGAPGQVIDYSNKTGQPAIWCSDSGKLVGRTVEGNGYRTVSVNTSLPLQQGQNTIELLWGNESGNYSGGMTLTGQIYNVAPVCKSPWIDECDALESSAGQVTIPK